MSWHLSFCARSSLTLFAPSVTSSEPFDRSGPVPAAVRAAGYVSEDEEETDEDGSSVEEESEEESESEDEEEGEHHRHHAHGTQTLTEAPAHEQGASTEASPSYTAPAAGSGIETGANGYAVEKKGVPPALGADGGEGSGLTRKTSSRKEGVSDE